MRNNNTTALIHGLDQLIRFLEKSNGYLVKELKDIKLQINDPAGINDGIKTLNQYFGGMGSLNDIYFCEVNENIPDGYTEKTATEELNVLLNNVFREMRLIGAPFPIRWLWHFYSWLFRKDSPARIKNAFSK